MLYLLQKAQTKHGLGLLNEFIQSVAIQIQWLIVIWMCTLCLLCFNTRGLYHRMFIKYIYLHWLHSNGNWFIYCIKHFESMVECKRILTAYRIKYKDRNGIDKTDTYSLLWTLFSVLYTIWGEVHSCICMQLISGHGCLPAASCPRSTQPRRWHSRRRGD